MAEKSKLEILFEDFEGEPEDHRVYIDWGEDVGNEKIEDYEDSP